MSIATAAQIPVSLPQTKDERRLRIGVIVDSLLQPLWAIRVLEGIESAQFIDLVLIIRMERQQLDSGSSALRLRSKVLDLWFRADERIFRSRCAQPDAFRPTAFMPSCTRPKMLAWPSQEASASVRQGVVDQIRDAEVDILLQLSTAASAMQLFDLARFGVWSFPTSERATTDVFWTVYRKKPVLENDVEVQQAGHQRIICASYLASDPVSLFRNHTNLYWKRADALLRCLSELRDSGLQGVEEHAQKPLDLRPPPRSSDVLRLTPRVVTRALGQQMTKQLARERWFVAFRKIIDTDEVAGRTSFTLLWPPDGRFYADPFICEHGGKTYIFFEDYSYAQGKAVISFVELSAEGSCSEPQLALEEDFHLAYPSLFQFNGELFLLPETKNRRTVQVYRATAFPRGWELAHILLADVEAADSTLFHHDGKFWLFTSGVGTADPWFDADSELSLFVASSLEGPWVAHPRNPVVADVRRSRCAGQLFFLGKHLVRPSQDCSKCYGHSVVLNRIDTLSETEYREVPVGRIAPDWMPGNLGTHTYNHSKNYEVLDGRTLSARYRLRGRPAKIQTLPASTQVLSPF